MFHFLGARTQRNVLKRGNEPYILEGCWTVGIGCIVASTVLVIHIYKNLFVYLNMGIHLLIFDEQFPLNNFIMKILLQL